MITKRAEFERLLATGESVYVILDGSHARATLPPAHRLDKQLCFEYGMHLSIPIEDMLISDDGIEGTLSFNRQPQFTFVPWDSVYCIRSQKEISFWSEEAPAGFEISVPSEPEPPERKKAKAPTRHKLRALTDADIPEEQPPFVPGPLRLLN